MSTNNTDNLELASMRSRAFAFVIDDFLITFLVLIVFWDNIGTESNDLGALLVTMNEFVWPVLFVKFLYQGFFIWYYGATIGKIITKIRVIDHDTLNRVSLFSAMLRSSARIVSEMFFYIGFIIGFFNDGRQTLHDKLGRTLVVNV